MESNRSENIVLIFQRSKAISHNYRLGELALNFRQNHGNQKPALCSLKNSRAITWSQYTFSKPHFDKSAGLVDQENAINIVYLDFKQGFVRGV